MSYTSRQIDKSLIEDMTDILAHRGPDGRGTWYAEGVALGHRRLSIIDLSSNGAQPMLYRDRYAIVFNGEVYNYIELGEELRGKGYVFSTRTDTEVVAAAFDLWGAEAVHRFNGMWSFAIYDLQEKTLFCSRDRFGVKPFYYTNNTERFAFASEIKALLPVLPGKPHANIPRLIDNIVYGFFDHTEETMFDGVKQLQPGHSLTIDERNGLRIQCYYDVSRIQYKKRSYAETVDEFRRLFIDAVDIRLRSDVTVGSCLSGGLDSSSIVCTSTRILRERGEGKHEVISSCYDKKDEKAYDEQEYIDEVVRSTGVDVHKVYPNIDDFFSDLDDIIYHQDEPIGGLSLESQFAVFKGAKKYGLTVMLDGQGADEQLAGYTAFYSVAIREYIRKFRLLSALREFRAFVRLRSQSEQFGLQVVLWHIVRDLLPPPIRKAIKKLMTKREEESWLKVSHDEGFIDKLKSYRDFDDYSKKSMKYGLLQLLHYEDRNSMANSIEGRLPFLDYRLVELALSSKLEYKMYKGVTKRVLRDAMKGILPEKIRCRYSKLGFAVPADLWITQYPERIQKELEASLESLGSVFDKDKVMEWFKSNKGNKIALANTTLWRIIVAGRWVNAFDVRVG